MTPIPDGAAELFMSTTDILLITGLRQGTDLHQDTGLRAAGHRALADLRAASLQEPGHLDRHSCQHRDRRQDAADEEGTATQTGESHAKDKQQPQITSKRPENLRGALLFTVSE